MKHVKKFDEFLQDENPNVDPKRKPDTGDAETTAKAEAPATDAVPTSEKPADTPKTEKPEDANTTAPDKEKTSKPTKAPSETPASDQADDTNDEIEAELEDDEDDKVTESAFHAALHKAKHEGKSEFEFKGKVFKIREKKKTNESIVGFENFIAENFALYPSYNNMLGSEVLRNVPITHIVNRAVYGKDYVIDQGAGEEPVVVAVVSAPEK